MQGGATDYTDLQQITAGCNRVPAVRAVTPQRPYVHLAGPGPTPAMPAPSATHATQARRKGRDARTILREQYCEGSPGRGRGREEHEGEGSHHTHHDTHARHTTPHTNKRTCSAHNKMQSSPCAYRAVPTGHTCWSGGGDAPCWPRTIRLVRNRTCAQHFSSPASARQCARNTLNPHAHSPLNCLQAA